MGPTTGRPRDGTDTGPTMEPTKGRPRDGTGARPTMGRQYVAKLQNFEPSGRIHVPGSEISKLLRKIRPLDLKLRTLCETLRSKAETSNPLGLHRRLQNVVPVDEGYG